MFEGFPSGGPKWEFEESKDKWTEFDRVNQRLLEGWELTRNVKE